MNISTENQKPFIVIRMTHEEAEKFITAVAELICIRPMDPTTPNEIFLMEIGSALMKETTKNDLP